MLKKRLQLQEKENNGNSPGADEDDLQIGKNESRLDKKSTKKRSAHKVHEHFEAIFYFRLAALANFQPQAGELQIMLEVVIDTNVLMSGMIWSGIPGKVLEAWALEKFNVALSIEIINEYSRVGKILENKAPKMNLIFEINKFIKAGHMYNPPKLNEQISVDPNDDMFIACALCTEAKVIISGDSDLLEIPKNKGIMVLKPRDFLEHYLSHC